MVAKENGHLELDGLSDLPDPVRKRIVLVSDKVFSQVVNSNLEVRTSVSIDPETGAAKKGALFTYEAIPRAAFLWTDVVVDDYRRAFPAYDELEGWKKILDDAKASDVGTFDILNRIGGFLRKYAAPVNNKSGDYEKDFGNARIKMLGYIQEEKTQYEAATLHDKRWKNVETDTPADVVTAGLEWVEHLGIGGMGTRGFGRIRMINCHKVG